MEGLRMGDPEVARVVVDGIPGRIVEIPTTVKR
jgi:hypothetical protein